MRAVVMRDFGDASVLAPDDVPDPRPRPGWTVVRLRAAALNWHDVLVRQGGYGSPLPHVIGSDGAGVDESTGDEVVVVPSLWWGDDESAPGPEWEILGDRRRGTYAERVAVPSECVLPRPASLGWAESAALPLVGLTTYRALVTRGGLRRGESLLVLGSGGGVATTALSLGIALGAHVVVTGGSDGKIARALALGAEGGVRYDDPSWPMLARALSPGGRGFDVVLDSVGTWPESLAAARPGGRVVVLGASRSERSTLEARPFYFGQLSLLGTTMGSPVDMTGLLRLVDEGRGPVPVVDRHFPLDRAADAHRYLESGAAFGKIVLDIAEEVR